MRTKRLVSSFLMAAGIVLVFYGFSSALGFTTVGVLASVAAISALLYAGGVLFGSAPATQSAAPRPADATHRDERRTIDVQPS